MTRQNYYARHKVRQRRAVDGELIAELVRRERQLQPRLGTRKLYHLLKPDLKRAGVRMGRDRMFEELKKRDLLLPPIPAPYPHTTQSYHNLPVFGNRIKDKELEGPNEVWVSDLSYLRTLEGFLYMALITDKYSRKIVGWHVGDTLEAMGCVRALDCCHEYVNRLQARGLSISMTEVNHCAENALAERMNGILKQEYGLGVEFVTKATAHQAVQQGIKLYNTRRPHNSLGKRTPAQVHQASLN
jgi:transposase InsO family protein